MKNNSSSFISDVFAFSKSAGKTRSPTLRCWRGRNSLASSPPCARHRHDGRVTYFERQTPVVPKQLLYDELSDGGRKIGGQRKRYKDSLKAYHKDFNIDVTTCENAASERLAWRSVIHRGALHSEFQRFNTAKEKRQTRKARADNAVKTPLTHPRCQSCGRDIHARIGLISHLRPHRSASIKS